MHREHCQEALNVEKMLELRAILEKVFGKEIAFFLYQVGKAKERRVWRLVGTLLYIPD